MSATAGRFACSEEVSPDETCSNAADGGNRLHPDHVVRARPGDACNSIADRLTLARKSTAQAFAASATDAVRAWQYEASARPVTFMMTVVIRPPTAGATPDAATPDVHLKKGDPSLRKIREVALKYPRQASMQLIQGVIVLDATIAPDGRVIDARVLRAIPHLDQAALDAVMQWEFDPLPSTIKGPGNVVTELMLNFKLR